MNTLKAGLVVFGLVIGTAAMAQDKGGKTPQERAQFRTDWMAKELSLTAEQTAKVSELNLQAVEKNQAIKNDASMSMEQKKEAWGTNRKAQKEQLKSILTADQLAALKAKKEAMHAKHKEGGKHKGTAKYRAPGKNTKTPQERAQMRTDMLSKELGLTEEQKTKMTDLNLKGIEKSEVIRNDAALTPEQKKAAMKSNFEEQRTQMKSILTADQLAKLKAMRESHKKERQH